MANEKDLYDGPCEVGELPTDSPWTEGNGKLGQTPPAETELTALINAEAENIELRQRMNSDPLPRLTSVERMRAFCNNTRNLKIDVLEEKMVNESMPVMIWLLRSYAIEGKYTEARAVEIWLNWAGKVSSRPKQAEKAAGVASGALFGAHLTKGQVYEAQATPIATIKAPKKTTAGRPKPPAFGKAGNFIGQHPKKGGKK